MDSITPICIPAITYKCCRFNTSIQAALMIKPIKDPQKSEKNQLLNLDALYFKVFARRNSKLVFWDL